jgi:hypothetical protein
MVSTFVDPVPFHRRRSTCRLCDSDNIECVLRLEPSPLADWYLPLQRASESNERIPLDLFLCHACGHVQLLDVIDPARLFSKYIYTTASSPGLVEHFRKYAETIVTRLSLPTGSLVVDVGSNDGTLLRCFSSHGMRVVGVDPAEKIAQAATAGGIPTLNTFFTIQTARQIVEQQGPAKLVTANNVFAHSDELGDMLDAIVATLADDGVFVFEVSYLLDTVEKLIFDYIYHEHLCYHSVKPMDAFLRRHGMQLFDIERMPSKGGSLRGFAQKLGGPRSVSPHIAELIDRESAAGLDQVSTYHQFIKRVNRLRDETTSVLRAHLDRGETVAGYGASATVTTLMHHFRLGNMIDFIVDDNPMRHGTVSPGYHIPVFHPSILYEKKPEAIVILAWRFAPAIMSRHQAYLELGGRFIIPVPAVTVIDSRTGTTEQKCTIPG